MIPSKETKFGDCPRAADVPLPDHFYLVHSAREESKIPPHTEEFLDKGRFAIRTKSCGRSMCMYGGKKTRMLRLGEWMNKFVDIEVDASEWVIEYRNKVTNRVISFGGVGRASMDLENRLKLDVIVGHIMEHIEGDADDIVRRYYSELVPIKGNERPGDEFFAIDKGTYGKPKLIWTRWPTYQECLALILTNLPKHAYSTGSVYNIVDIDGKHHHPSS